jgi:UDP-2-acetamido-3-amino-2,3-dideoxy-glucuronate N-acetyltransferase
MAVFVHPQGLNESTTVGEGTRIWAFAHVLPGARIGDDCNICDHVFIENDVVVGHRVTIKCGVQLWDGVRLADEVFVGPNVTFTNDPFPRSKHHPSSFARTSVGFGASIGANATILPGLVVGRRAMVGAGAVVTKDVPPNAIVVGNPARIIGYAELDRPSAHHTSALAANVPEATRSKVVGASLIELTRADDLRGSLIAVEFDTDLPFVPKRIFTVFDVPSKDVRGAHAHRQCEQLLVCLRGSVTAVADDGTGIEEFQLDRPDIALHMLPMVWGIQYQYSTDAVLMVLASHAYDPSDYIRDYDSFLAETRR